MKEKSKISVIMTTYNHEKYVDEAINSVLSQTYQNFELIVIDDSSTDNTVEIANSFIDPRIKLITQKHQGPSVAINTGLRNSTGEFIAFMSGDDVSHENRLESQVSQIGLYDAGIIFTRPDLIGPKSETLRKEICPWFYDKEFSNNVELYRNLFYFGNFLVAPSAFGRKVVFNEIGPFNPGLIQLQDFDYWIRAVKKRIEIRLIEVPLIKYRYLFGNNLSDKSNNNRLKIEVSWIYRNFFNKTPVDIFTNAFIDKGNTAVFEDILDMEIFKSILLFSHPDVIVKVTGAGKIIEQLQDEEYFSRYNDMEEFNIIDFFTSENLINMDDLYIKEWNNPFRSLLSRVKRRFHL